MSDLSLVSGGKNRNGRTHSHPLFGISGLDVCLLAPYCWPQLVRFFSFRILFGPITTGSDRGQQLGIWYEFGGVKLTKNKVKMPKNDLYKSNRKGQNRPFLDLKMTLKRSKIMKYLHRMLENLRKCRKNCPQRFPHPKNRSLKPNRNFHQWA